MQEAFLSISSIAWVRILWLRSQTVHNTQHTLWRKMERAHKQGNSRQKGERLQAYRGRGIKL